MEVNVEGAIDIVPVTPISMLPPRPMNPELPPALVIDDQLVRLRLAALIRMLPAFPSPSVSEVMEEPSIDIVPGVLIAMSPPPPAPELPLLLIFAKLVRLRLPALS